MFSNEAIPEVPATDLELRPEKCPECEYLLAGLPVPVRCPECGLEVNDDLVLAVWDWDRTVGGKLRRWQRGIFLGVYAAVLGGLWLLLKSDAGVVLWPAALLSVCAIAGWWRGMGVKPTHRLWMSPRGYRLWYGKQPGQLRIWPMEADMAVRPALDGMVVLHLTFAEERLTMMVVTAKLNEAQADEISRRVKRWVNRSQSSCRGSGSAM